MNTAVPQPAPNGHFYRRPKNGGQLEHVTEELLRAFLHGNYKNVDLAIAQLQGGDTLPTPFYDYIYDPATPRKVADVGQLVNEMLAKLRSVGCAVSEADGIITVVNEAGETWVFTRPMRKEGE